VPLPALIVKLCEPEPPVKAFCKTRDELAPTPITAGSVKFKAIAFWEPEAPAKLSAMLAELLPSVPIRRTPKLLPRVSAALALSDRVPADNKAFKSAAVPAKRVAVSVVCPTVKLPPTETVTPLPVRLGMFNSD